MRCCPSYPFSLAMDFTLRGERSRFVAQQGEARSRLPASRLYLVRNRNAFCAEPLSNERGSNHSEARVSCGLRAMIARHATSSVVSGVFWSRVHEQTQSRDHPFHYARGAVRRQGRRVAARARSGARRHGIRARRSPRLPASVLRRANVAAVDATQERSRAALDEENSNLRWLRLRDRGIQSWHSRRAEKR